MRRVRPSARAARGRRRPTPAYARGPSQVSTRDDHQARHAGADVEHAGRAGRAARRRVGVHVGDGRVHLERRSSGSKKQLAVPARVAERGAAAAAPRCVTASLMNAMCSALCGMPVRCSSAISASVRLMRATSREVVASIALAERRLLEVERRRCSSGRARRSARRPGRTRDTDRRRRPGTRRPAPAVYDCLT